MSHARKSSHVRALAVWTLSLIFGACEAIAASSSLNLAADEVLNLNESFFVTQADAGEVNEHGDQSGAAITDGDFNGDGFVDLAVGSPGEGPDAGSGAVSIFLGSEAGVTTGFSITQAAAGKANEAGDRFGAALFAGDFNGDGFEELVVGAPGEAPGTDPRSGAIFIFPGSEEGITTGFMITQTVAGEVNEEGDRFGAAVTVGEFNGDGFEDLVVGAPGKAPGTDPRSGVVFVFPGSEAGLTTAFLITQTDAGEVNEEGDQFGASLATGDFEGDAFQELVVGAPGEAPGKDPKSGAVFVFSGTATGLLTTPGFLITQTNAGEMNEEGDQFGAALFAGDIDSDNDKIEELAIGAPGKAPGTDPRSGAVFVFRGSSPTGLLTTPGFMITQADAGGVNEEGDRFGAAVVLGVFSGDPFEELAVGAPGDAPDGGPRSGAVYVFPGSESGIITPGFMITQADAGGANEEGDQFGASLAAEDFNDTNAAELAVGAAWDAPGAAPRSGAIFIFPGVNRSPPSINQENDGGVNEYGDKFGSSSVTGDFNGDGFKDLAIGAPGEDRNSGVVFLFPGSEVGTGITTGYFITRADAGGRRKRGGKFGAALAAGDFNGDGFDDLAVGAPGGNPQSRAVFMFPGSAEGITTGFSINGRNRNRPKAHKFGAALAAGDLNGDGFDDLVVEAPRHGSRVKPKAGGVFVFPGSRAGISTGFFVRTLGRARFGAALAVADFNHDGFEDLAVGAPGKGRESGAVFLFPGSEAGISRDFFITRRGAGKVNKAGARFGATLATGDFNGDGFDDLAVGAPREARGADPRSGAVFLFPGSEAGISADFLIITQTDAHEVNETGDRFGAALAAGDFNGDGIGDLVVGAPEKGDPRSGAIFIFPGSEEGISRGYFAVQEGNGGANEEGDRFGTALAFGDFDGNHLDDLAVGAPGEAPGLDPKSGAVYIIDEEECLAITEA